jgi:hypothetical protein
MRVEFPQFHGRLLNVFLTPENKFRNDLIERVNPYLERDEHVQRLFIGSTGPSPYLSISIMIAVFSLLARSRIVAVTNRSIVVFSTRGFRANRPKAIIRRLPRQTRLGPVKGSTSRVLMGADAHPGG